MKIKEIGALQKDIELFACFNIVQITAGVTLVS